MFVYLHIVLYAFVGVCICICVCTYLFVCMFVYVGQLLILDKFTSSSPPYFLRHAFLLNLELDGLTNKSSCLRLPNIGITRMCHCAWLFNVGVGDPTQIHRYVW